MKQNDISEFVYKGPHWERQRENWKLDTDRCVHRVHGKGRDMNSYQCQRGPKEKIQGYGFCTQHADMVKKALGIAKSIRTIYVTRHIGYGSFCIWKMQVHRETKTSFYVFGAETVFGEYKYYDASCDKSIAHDDLNSAIQWTIDRIHENIQSLESKQQKYATEITALQAMLK